MSSNVKKIEVLGPGCARCRETHRTIVRAVEEAGLSIPVDKVESVDRMVELGVLTTPAVAVDGRLVLSGRIPKSEEVRALLGLD